MIDDTGPDSRAARMQRMFGPDSPAARMQRMFGPDSPAARMQQMLGPDSPMARLGQIFGTEAAATALERTFGSSPSPWTVEQMLGVFSGYQVDELAGSVQLVQEEIGVDLDPQEPLTADEIPDRPQGLTQFLIELSPPGHAFLLFSLLEVLDKAEVLVADMAHVSLPRPLTPAVDLLFAIAWLLLAWIDQSSGPGGD